VNGPCGKAHDDLCKQEYQNSSKKHTYPYEREFVAYLNKLIEDLDKRIRRGHERLDQDEKFDHPLTGESAEKEGAISNRIQTLLQQIEDLGEEGRVEESQQLMKVVDQLKSEKEQLLLINDTRAISSQEKRMRVCEICGAFLVVGDTDKRIASHMEGKQHQGYALIRKTLEEYATKRIDDRKTPDYREKHKHYPPGQRDKNDTSRGYRTQRDMPYRERDSAKDRRRERSGERDDYDREHKRLRDD